MIYRTLGHSGLTVSALCLGTMHFGSVSSRKEGLAILSKAFEQGLNFMDTGDVFGPLEIGQRGGAERIVGEWLAQNRSRRDRIVLSSQVYGEMGYGPSADQIRRSLEASLRRLKTDHVDVLLMHRIGVSGLHDETLDVLDGLRREGKLTHIGSSHLAGWHIATVNQEAARRGLPGVVREQCAYSLLSRSFELEVLPAARAYDVAVTTWNPVATGVLGGALAQMAAGQRVDPGVERAVQSLRPRLAAWESFCRELGHPPAAVATAWLLHNPRVTAAGVGPRDVDQLGCALQALQVRLSPEALERIDRIFPGPVREAPEAFWAIAALPDE